MGRGPGQDAVSIMVTTESTLKFVKGKGSTGCDHVPGIVWFMCVCV